jgi:hypothetical protein
MKTAVCLHGYYGTVSTGDFSTSKGGKQHIEEQILSKCKDVDFYVHCWQPEFKEEIINNYSPKQSVFQEQIDFKEICIKNNIHQNYFDELFQREKTMYKNANIYRILSFYYSRCESIKMALDKGYDWVITTRFDISQRGGCEVNQIRFLIGEDRDYLYTTEWNQKNVGYGDMWFYGSNEIMKEYSKIYKAALSDFKPLSKYEKAVTTAWPDSNYFDVYDFSDTRQFTNEVDKKEKSKSLMKFPKWRVTDSHLYHKWFCMNSGLYEKTRWV